MTIATIPATADSAARIEREWEAAEAARRRYNLVHGDVIYAKFIQGPMQIKAAKLEMRKARQAWKRATDACDKLRWSLRQQS